jgi:predicted ATPase
LTPFEGREEDLAALSDLLLQEGLRLITITGPGGIGKTRLATEIAAQISANFAHGLSYVSLAPLDSSTQIVQTLIEALALSSSIEHDPQDQLLRYLRSRQMLLVIDNFEHLLDGAPLLSKILEAAPGVTILVTSREKMSLQSETVFNLRGLEVTHWETPEEALSYTSARLFVQYAQRGRPSFSLEQADVHALGHICRVVEGLPLGIVLAASWTDTLTPQEIAIEIDKSLDFLGTKYRDMPERQRSIRAVFDTSWERLNPEERELVTRLSIFRGGFTREAAEYVAGALLRDLSGLVNKSLLRRDPDSGRYEQHELLRQYARERLEATSENFLDARTAHATYFADFMAKRTDHLLGSRDTLALLEIESDIENVRAAWHISTDSAHLENVNKFIESLFFVYEIRGWNHAGRDLFGEARTTLGAITEGDDAEAVKAWLLGAESFFTGVLGIPQQGVETARESVEILQRLGRRREQFLALFGIALGYMVQNMGKEVIHHARQGVEVASEEGEKWWEALFTNWLASGSLTVGAHDDTRRYAQASLDMMVDLGGSYGIVWPHQTLGSLAMVQGSYVEARKFFERALDAEKSIKFKRGLQYTYNSLGNVNILLDAVAEAEKYFLQSLNVSHEIGQTREVLTTLLNLAKMRATSNRKLLALELLAVVLQHPVSAQHGLFTQKPIRDNAEQLRARLEEELSPEDYAAAWERGKNLELDQVVVDLLADL